MDDPTRLPAPPQSERCYRHPDEETLVHCTRCGRPICPRCMVPAPVGHHCPTCVAEARREFRGGPGRRAAIAGLSFTRAFIVAIVAMFLLEIVASGGGRLFGAPDIRTLVDLGAAAPVLIAEGEWWRLLSAMFLHAGVLHLALNAWALWLFGNIVERDFGHLRFVAIFFVAGFLGSVVSYAFSPVSCDGVFRVGVGASGAIVGLLGAFLAFYYRRRHTAIGRAYVSQALTIIALNALIGFTIANVDNLAHLGGLVAGAACGLVADRDAAGRSGPLAWLGFAAIVAVGVVLAIMHTNDLREALPTLSQLCR